MMLNGQPLHLVFGHVLLLGRSAAVRTNEDDFEVLAVGVAELDEARGEPAAGWAPLGGEVDAHDLSFKRVARDFLSLHVVELGWKQVVQAGRQGLSGSEGD